MTMLSSVAVIGQDFTAIRVINQSNPLGLVCLVPKMTPLGSLIGVKEIETKTIMYSSDDGSSCECLEPCNHNNKKSLMFKGLARTRVEKPKKNWSRCRCGMAIRNEHQRPPKATLTSREMWNNRKRNSFPIPYSTKHPRNSIVEQITYIRGGKY